MVDLEDLRLDDVPAADNGERRHWRPLVIVGILVACGMGLAVVMFGRSEQHGSSAPEVAPPVPVSTLSASTAAEFTAAGYIEVIPPGPTVITAPVAGTILSIEALEGQTIAAGQVVARLDPHPYALQEGVAAAALASAQAQLAKLAAGYRPEEIAQAESAVALAQARLVQMNAERERRQQLRQSGISSQRDLDAAVADAAVAEATLQANTAELEIRRKGTRLEDLAIGRAAVARVQADLDLAHWRVEACTMRAPSAGVVLERYARPGDWLDPSTNQVPPAAVMAIVDPIRVQAWADVNQRDIGRVREGEAVTIATDAFPSRLVPGVVSSILPKANLQKNTVQVKIRIPDPPQDLRPETSVRISFMGGAAEAPTPKAP